MAPPTGRSAWYIHPSLVLAGYAMFAIGFSGLGDAQFWILNPLSLAGYLGTLLYAIPINLFSLFAIACYVKHGGKHPLIAGISNLLISLFWLFSIYRFGWIITV